MNALPEQVERRIVPEPNSGCWLWTGPLSSGGYARARYRGPMRYMHRVTYEILVGSVPEGLDLDHLCRTRSCVNPAHLEPVTRRVNCLRGETGHPAGRAKLAKTHCPHGHSYADRGSLMPAGNRRCLECAKQRARAHRAAKGATR